MAIKLEDKPNTSAPDSDYPFGNIVDDTGVDDGTPLNKLVHADFHQFFAKMLDASGVVANGFPDNDYSGFQYFEALLAVISQDPTIAALVAAVVAIETPEVWTDATLSGGWTNFGAGTANVGYYLDASGIVRLRGVVSYAAAGVVTNVTLFTLPVGYRPAAALQFMVYFDFGATSITSFDNAKSWSFSISTAGVVALMANSNFAATFDLSSISFRNI